MRRVTVEVLQQPPPEILGAADHQGNRAGRDYRDVHAAEIVPARSMLAIPAQWFILSQAHSRRAARRPRLAVATTFPIAPAIGGGQVRALNLYRGLSRVFDVELVTLGAPDTPETHRQLGPGLWEHRVPKSLAHAERESALEREAGTVVTDVASLILPDDACIPDGLAQGH